MPLCVAAPRPPAGAAVRQLVGPWYQTAGDIWVVDSEYEVDRLYERLLTKHEAFGFDSETVGVDPRKMSPARGDGRVISWSCAFTDEKLGLHPLTGYPLARRVFVKNWGEAEERRWLHRFQEWFEGADYWKVGANVFSFDRHIMWNHGIDLHGIIFDNVRASRLNNPAGWDHSLKFQGSVLGYEMREYGSLFSRPVILKNGREGVKQRIVPLTEVVQDPSWLDTLIDYASLDAKVSLEAYWPMADNLRRRPWIGERTMLDYYNDKLNPFMYALTGTERNGWDLDTQWCHEQATIAEYDIGQLERKLVEWTGVVMSFGSPKQLGHYLYGDKPEIVVKAMKTEIPGRGFPVPPVSKAKKNKRYPRPGEPPPPPERPTDEIALSWLADHVRAKRDQAGLRALLEWRTVVKTKQYLDKLPLFIDGRGRVHCQLGPDTETGRLAARNPPLQQIPKPGKDPIADRYSVREAFGCPPGYQLICADFSQLEMRLLAHFLIVLFDDHVLADDLAAGDLHAATALRTFGAEKVHTSRLEQTFTSWAELDPFTVTDAGVINTLDGIPRDTPLKAVKSYFPAFRDKGKVVNFSINYGKTAFGLGRDLRDEDGNPIGDEAAQDILDAYFQAYPGVLKYKNWSIQYARDRGYARTLAGRYRPLPNILSEINSVRRHDERRAMNTPIQGSAFDVAMNAQLKTNTHDVPELRDRGYYDEELARMEVETLMQIHDELVFRVPVSNTAEAMARIKVLMEDPFERPLTVPLPVEVGRGMNWREAH